MSITNPISANTLFHFTNSRENLLNILENEFCPKYSAEDIPTLNIEGEEPHFYCPIVCFSDVPLSRVKDHSEFYGSYALGLSKEWAEKNGLNPVFYLQAGSFPSKALRNITDTIYRDSSDAELLIFNRIVKYLLPFNLYTKRYKGRPWRRGERQKNERIFYNEKEWRYVPSAEIAERINIPLTAVAAQYNFEKSKFDSYERALKDNAKLKFEPSDIKYIIVKNDEDILYIIRELERIKGSELRYPPDIVKILTTRIITMDQINSDF